MSRWVYSAFIPLIFSKFYIFITFTCLADTWLMELRFLNPYLFTDIAKAQLPMAVGSPCIQGWHPQTHCHIWGKQNSWDKKSSFRLHCMASPSILNILRLIYIRFYQHYTAPLLEMLRLLLLFFTGTVVQYAVWSSGPLLGNQASINLFSSEHFQGRQR